MNARQLLQGSLFLFALFLAKMLGAQSAPRDTVLLYTWYSASRGDFMTTTDPAWRAEPGTVRSGGGDYKMVRVEGMVFPADRPQPPETVALYNWWSESRKDNFLTTDRTWAGRVGDVRPGQGDYRLFRIEGFVHTLPLSGTLPLLGLWNGESQDNHATTDPVFAGSEGSETVSPLGRYRRFRVHGYVLPRRDEGVASDDETLRRGYGYERLAPAVPQIPVLVLLHEWSDVSFPADAVEELRRAFVPSSPGTTGLTLYGSYLSAGRFRFEDVQVAGPFRDSISRAEAERRGGPAARVGAVGLAARAGLDFRRYDRDRNGRVDGNELRIVRYEAGAGVGGQAGDVSVRASGVQVETSVLLVARDTPLSGTAHELLHVFGTEDIYGPGYALNGGASVMAGMLGARDHRTLQLDSWHRMQLGWLRPRILVRPGVGAAPGGLFSIRASGAPEPILVIDPGRPREFFLLEARDPAHPGDKAGPGPGLLVWHILTDADSSLRTIWRRDDAANRVRWPRGADTNQQIQGALSLGDAGGLGVPRAWTASDAPLRLRWFDGREAGFEVAVRSVASGGIVASIVATGTSPFPRLDFAPSPVARGSAFTITGEFPAADLSSWRVVLKRGATRVPLAADVWALYGVTVRVPATEAPGPGEIMVETSPGRASNSLAVELR